MCEKCGFTGCRHDWKRWQQQAYERGHADAAAGRPSEPGAGSAYLEGYAEGSSHAAPLPLPSDRLPFDDWPIQ